MRPGRRPRAGRSGTAPLSPRRAAAAPKCGGWCGTPRPTDPPAPGGWRCARESAASGTPPDRRSPARRTWCVPARPPRERAPPRRAAMRSPAAPADRGSAGRSREAPGTLGARAARAARAARGARGAWSLIGRLLGGAVCRRRLGRRGLEVYPVGAAAHDDAVDLARLERDVDLLAPRIVDGRPRGIFRAVDVRERAGGATRYDLPQLVLRLATRVCQLRPVGGERVARDPVHGRGRGRVLLRRRQGVAERAGLGQHLVRRVEGERVGLDRIEGRHGLRARRVASPPLPPAPLVCLVPLVPLASPAAPAPGERVL